MLDITRAVVTLLAIVCIFKYEICSNFTFREMNAQSPLCSFDIFAMNNLFMTVIVNVLLYQKTLNYVDVRVMILAELIVHFNSTHIQCNFKCGM